MCHPKPKGPLPAPESYERFNCGPNPERPGLAAIGTDIEPVPVTGLAANFSPIPRIAPPPFGSEICGEFTRNLSSEAAPLLALSSCWACTTLLQAVPSADSFLTMRIRKVTTQTVQLR